jgi:hypothetical protein
VGRAMIEIALQLGSDYRLKPPSHEDLEALKAYSPNQILRAKLTGFKKPRSYQQLKLYWACCRAISENLENMTKEDVDFHVKIKLKHWKNARVVNGVTIIEPGSISFVELNHLEACNFFDRAFPVMAKMIGVSTEELLKNAET